jgi:WD40 repeat protein
MTVRIPARRRFLAGAVCLLTLVLLAWATPPGTVAQDQKKDDPKKAEQNKDDKKDVKEATKDKKDAQKDKKDEKAKTEPKKEEPKDERIYPRTEPVLTIKGHTDWITQIRLAPDGKSLVTGSRDKTIRFWGTESGKETAKIAGLASGVLALALSPDGTKVATTSGKWLKDKQAWVGEIDLFDVKSGKQIATIKGHSEPILAIAFHPQGEQIVTASEDGSARVWEVATGKELLLLKGHTGPVAAVAYSPSGDLIATGGEDKTVKLWSAKDGKEIRSEKKHDRRVDAVAFSPDGKLLVAGGQDGTVTIWETVLGDGATVPVRTFKTGEGVLAVALSPDGAKLAAAGWGNAVQIWDTKSGKELGGLAGHERPISSVVFNLAGDRVISASLDQTVCVWDVSAAKQKVDPPKKAEPKKEETKK